MEQRFSPYVEDALRPRQWKVQRPEYYAAHFLVGSGLTAGDLDGHVRALATALEKEYLRGVRHGMNAEVAG